MMEPAPLSRHAAGKYLGGQKGAQKIQTKHKLKTLEFQIEEAFQISIFYIPLRKKLVGGCAARVVAAGPR